MLVSCTKQRKRARLRLPGTNCNLPVDEFLHSSQIPIQEVRQSDLTHGADRELMKSVTADEAQYVSQRAQADNDPGKLAHQKHQITWLAHQVCVVCDTFHCFKCVPSAPPYCLSILVASKRYYCCLLLMLPKYHILKAINSLLIVERFKLWIYWIRTSKFRRMTGCAYGSTGSILANAYLIRCYNSETGRASSS